jgi:hypothetical protein
MLRVYRDALVGTVPPFPPEMESRIDAYLAVPAGLALASPVAALTPREHRPAPMDGDRTID